MKNLLMIPVILFMVSAPGNSQQTPLPEQGAPPTTLTERDGYVSANNAPPSTENFEVHVVEEGDTLWGIASQYLNNPFLWPQLWEANEHILNPHWIYPQDPILIRAITQITDAAPPPVPEAEPVVEEPAPAAQVRLPARPRLTPDAAIPEVPPVVFTLPDLPPVFEVKAVDLYCSGFITTREISSDLNVMAKFPVSESVIATEGDYVYLSRGANSGIATGDLFTAVRSTRKVNSTRESVGELGLHYLEVGQMRAVMVQPEFSMARVLHSCDGIEVGDLTIAFNEIAFPELPSNRPFDSMMPSNGKTTGAIAMSRGTLSNSGSPLFGGTTVVPGVAGGRLGGIAGGMVSEGQVVYIDLGDQDGIRTGDLFLIYRPMDTSSPLHPLPKAAARLIAGQRQVVGELVVLKVEERAAAALVTFTSGAVFSGDSIELR